VHYAGDLRRRKTKIFFSIFVERLDNRPKSAAAKSRKKTWMRGARPVIRAGTGLFPALLSIMSALVRTADKVGHRVTSEKGQQQTLTEGASTAVRLLRTGLYAVVVRVLKIGLAVCPLLAGVFANRLTPAGTIFLGAEKEPLYSALRCSGGFFGVRARIDGQENHNQDHGRRCSTRKRYRKPTQRHAVPAHLCKTYA